MMHSKSLKTMLAVATVVSVAFAAPNKHEISNEIVPIGNSKNGEAVSASWGGFKASALLAEDGSAAASVGGNGLGAGAGYGTGGAGAGAGVYGSGASAGSASGGYGSAGNFGSASAGTGTGGGFFDRIFAIPINVLQSVNTYLNQKQQGQLGAAYGHPAKPGSSADKVPEVSVGADYGQGGAAGAYAEAGTKVGHGKAGDSMMIPITALRSVQNLLNG